MNFENFLSKAQPLPYICQQESHHQSSYTPAAKAKPWCFRFFLFPQPIFIKHFLSSFALAAGLGTLALTACEKTQVEVADSPTLAGELANPEFAKLKQLNGKPVNSHLATMVALSIDQTNKYNLFYNKLTRAQEKATLAQTEELLKQPLTAQTLEQLVRLEGYADLAEYQVAEAQYKAERALLLKEDPGYFKLSAQDQKAMLKLIYEYYYKLKLHPIVPVTVSSRKATIMRTNETSATNDSPDDPWTGPAPSEEAAPVCWTAWYACSTAANITYQNEREYCQYQVGPIMAQPCIVAVLYKYREAEKSCLQEYYDCASRQGS